MTTTLTATTTRPEDRFLHAFEAYAGEVLNGTSEHLAALRRKAIERFGVLGFPGRKSEAWKYTPIAKALQHPYRIDPMPAVPALTEQALAGYAIPELDAYRVVLVNGRFVPELSTTSDLPEGVVLTGLEEAARRHADLFEKYFAHYLDFENEPFLALNTAFARDGFFLYVPEGATLERPVHVFNLIDTDEELFLQPRNVVVAAPGASLKLVTSGHNRTAQRTFTNGVTEVFVGQGAEVHQYDLRLESEAASGIFSTQAYLEGGARYTNGTLTLGGALVRNNVYVRFDDQEGEAHLYGFFLGRGSMHIDNHTRIDHAVPHCVSNELYKGILDDEATGVFNGKVLVRPHAQKTNAYQSNKSIVLTREARMYSKPELEIYADDVRCTHGAAIGQLDEDGIFYLRARGLTLQKARAMMLLAFARDVLDQITIEPLRAYLDELVAGRFGA
jgi:Fe-S cluster assembly protein SufD